jgi:hypothetical protein
LTVKWNRVVGRQTIEALEQIKQSWEVVRDVIDSSFLRPSSEPLPLLEEKQLR